MFCGSRVDPSSDNDWNLVGTKTRSSQNNEPIPGFSLGSNFKKQFVAIDIIVSNAKSHWSSGGYAHQNFNYPGLKISNPTNFLKLNTANLIELVTDEDYSYELIYYPRKYFKDVTVKTWEYIGAITTNNIDLTTIVSRIESLEDKINLLL